MENCNTTGIPLKKTSNKDKNINIVIIKNLDKDYEVNSNDYLNLIKDNNILKPDYTNLNINIILIHNIISNEKIKLQNRVETIPLNEKDLLLQTGNNNVNLMVIKNIIPL